MSIFKPTKNNNKIKPMSAKNDIKLRSVDEKKEFLITGIPIKRPIVIWPKTCGSLNRLNTSAPKYASPRHINNTISVSNASPLFYFLIL